jgi:hypothetical protein
MNRIFRTLLGSTDLKTAGYGRVWRGLRRGDRRDLYLGVTLALVSLLRQKSNDKQLIFRKKLPEGSALVIHHKKKGDPKIEVIRP